MTFYTEKKALKSTIPFLIDKAEVEGFTAVKFPYGKTIRLTNFTGRDANGIEHKVEGTNGNSSYPAHRVFSRSFENYWQGASGATGTSYVTYDFGVNNPTVVNAYYIQAMSGDRRTLNTAAPKKWTFYGSNEDLGASTVWTPLDMRENCNDWRHQEKRYFKFSNTTAYRLYKLEITMTNGATLQIAQFELFNTADLIAKPNEISAAYLVSKGSSTFDNVNIYLDSGDCYNNAITSIYSGNFYHVATIESFDPVTLEQRNMMLDTHYLARSNAGMQNNNSIMLTLYTDISKDRIVFATILDPSASNPATNASYVGLMKRYSNEGNNSGLVNAVGMFAPYSYPAVMKNKAGTYYQPIVNRVVSIGYSPSVWGDNVFVSPVFLEGDYEGVRGELEEVYTARVDNLVNEDEILIGSIRYKVIIISSNGSCSFPYQCIVFKLPSSTIA
ncbi:hypothetical protein ACPA0F_18125 [Solibacillus silvestris]